MKKLYPYVILFVLLTFCSSNLFAQKLYDDKTPLAFTKGKRLTLTGVSNPMFPSDFLSFEIQDTSNYEFNINLYADYRHWKFTDKLMLGAYGKAGIEYHNSRHDQTSPFDTTVTLNKVSTTVLTSQLYGAASYYITPDKFYVTGAMGISYAYSKLNSQTYINVISDSSVMPSYLWGAIGYGRINNRQTVEVSYDFDEALRKTGIISSKLDEKTLLKLSELLYRFRDGEYQDKYEDDQQVELFREIEKTLLNAGYISGSLDAASTVRLYEILNNTSGKYVFYPKYSGWQAQGQIQYQVANETKNKPHNHYLSLSGIYCHSLSEKTNMVFSGYVAVPMDTLANDQGAVAGFQGTFQNYLAFLPNRNNLDFFSPYPPFAGTGYYGGAYAWGTTTYIGVKAEIFHSISSVSGVQGSVALLNRKTKGLSNFLQYQITGRYDYNILSRLQAYGKMELLRESFPFGQLKAKLSGSIGLTYRVF